MTTMSGMNLVCQPLPDRQPHSFDQRDKSSACCTITYSSNWKILAAEGTETILGFSPMSLIGQQGNQLFHPNEKVPNIQESGKLILLHRTSQDYAWVNMTLAKENDSGAMPSTNKSYQFFLCRLHDRPSNSIDQIPSIPSDHLNQQLLPSYSIMIVEDNLLNQKVLQRLLEGLNQKVLAVAANGKEAMEQLNRSEILPDLIITDRCMPIMNGYEFIKSLRQDNTLSSLPCMLWSEGEFSTEDFKNLGIEIFLPKPINKSGLIKSLTLFAVQKGALTPSHCSSDREKDRN